jgi:hypothetical protein
MVQWCLTKFCVCLYEPPAPAMCLRNTIQATFMPTLPRFCDLHTGGSQINTALKVGVMWDHNGTYMEGFGFQYRDQKVQVELTRMDELAGEYIHCQCPWRMQWWFFPARAQGVLEQTIWLAMLHACLTCTNLRTRPRKICTKRNGNGPEPFPVSCSDHERRASGDDQGRD